MTTMEAADAATKQRIIKHMNADHHDSIRRYLEAYASKSMFQSRSAQMVDINLHQMVFSCGGEQAVVAFDPPMKALREARERVVQMDKEALQVLGRSDIPITKFIPPYAHLGHLWNFTQCVLAFVLLPRPQNWEPGSFLYDHALYLIPWFANSVAHFGWIVFAMMLPLHAAEGVIMAKKLARHGCTFLDAVWWKWVGTCFVEGITSFWRLDALIEEKRQEKEAKKH
ncbi:integral membrane protein [Stemphylium lycopersici]|uniref:Integral membrane protein n=1 Tax=Stemphylium lycopersici TaxID=183478 RepID=A0A364NG49_STELY|nr:integral membrane protein [Stemphylium lycopersici]RAR16304.1 integral membrane protein [Stemphylium lycopersici]